MSQIRIHWSTPGRKNEYGVSRVSGRWIDRTKRSQENLEFMVEVACEIHGAGSHWIERRKSPGTASPNPSVTDIALTTRHLFRR